jgi:hypothetical protein
VPPPRVTRPDLAQAMSVPPHPEPSMIDARPPSE